MNAPLIEKIRQVVEAHGDRETLARLRDEILAQRDGARLMDDYQRVHELTAHLVLAPHAPPPAPPCPTPRARPVAIAAIAAVAMAAAAVVWAVLAWPPTPPQPVQPPQPPVALRVALRVTLRSIALAPVESTPPSELEVPAYLVDYAPVTLGTARWLDDLAAGRRISELSHRPVLVMLGLEGCPLLAHLESQLALPANVVRLDAFVPVRLDLMKAPPELQALAHRYYPVLAVIDAAGTPEQVLEVPGGDLAAALSRPTTSTLLDWPQLQAQARDLVDARAAEATGRLGTAWTAYARAAALGTPLDAADPMSRFARDRQGRLSSEAGAELLAARNAFAASPTDAQARLARAAERFAGSPPGVELAAVLAAIRDTGLFPELVVARD